MPFNSLVITCSPFEPIANGRIEVTGLTYASVARFTCDPGYYITGSAIRSCDKNEKWNGIKGICIRKYYVMVCIIDNLLMFFVVSTYSHFEPSDKGRPHCYSLQHSLWLER